MGSYCSIPHSDFVSQLTYCATYNNSSAAGRNSCMYDGVTKFCSDLSLVVGAVEGNAFCDIAYDDFTKALSDYVVYGSTVATRMNGLSANVFPYCSEYVLPPLSSSSSSVGEPVFDWGLAEQGFKESFPLFLTIFCVYCIVKILHFPFK